MGRGAFILCKGTPMSRWRRLCVASIFVVASSIALTASVTSAAAPTPNYQGMWAVPNLAEAGWGINFTHQGDILFASWFTYDANGKPFWVSMTAQLQSDGSYTGSIDQTSGSPFSALPYDPTLFTHNTVGTGRVTFSDTNNGTFAYTLNGVSQVKPLARFVFAAPVPVCTFNAALTAAQAHNYTDMWAVPDLAEPGWGINFTHQGDTIFVSWFIYDANGAPFWVSATLTKTVAGTYAGALDATTGPSFNSVPFDSSHLTHSNVGTATVTFADGNNGTFTYTLNGVSRTKALTRFVFVAPGTVCEVASAASGAEGLWIGTTSTGQSVRAIILDDGTYYILYSRGGIDFGVLQGSSTAVNGVFTSLSDGMDFPIAIAEETSGVGSPATVSGTYVPHSSLQLTISGAGGTRTLMASYDASYEQPASLAAAAGSYKGKSGHAGGERPSTAFSLDATGLWGGQNDACAFTGTYTPRKSVNVFDWTVKASGTQGCIFGRGPLSGIMYYDPVTRQIHGFAPFLGDDDEWFLIGTKQ
jgi:hypothetical protein